MNKLLFLILTLVLLIVAMFAFEIIADRHMLSEYYVPLDVAQDISEGEKDKAMSFEEYMGYIDRGEVPEVSDITELPYDIQMYFFRVYSFRIFIFVVAVLLSVFGGFVMKGNRVDFSLLQLDPSYRIINMARIAMYVSAVMLVFITSQRYASAFLLGWLYPSLWLVILAVLVVWILNIIYAIKDNRANKLKSKIIRTNS